MIARWRGVRLVLCSDMSDLYNYIDNLKENKTKNDNLEIVDNGFLVQISHEKKNKTEGTVPTYVKNVGVSTYQNGKFNLLERLYSLLNLFYLHTSEIPKYTLKRDSNKKNKLFFHIDYKFDDDSKLTEFLKSLSVFKNKAIKQLYVPISSTSKLSESKDIGIIQSNTKTRRLGYLKLVIELFENSNYFPNAYLSRKVESDSALYEKDLIEYGDNEGDSKGIIKKTKSGSSAKPYIELLEELNLITLINNSFILTKQSKIYYHSNILLKDNNKVIKNSLFELNLLDKLFFLRQILITDPLYISAILEILFIAQRPLNTMSIKKLFVDYVKNELDQNQQYSSNNNTKRKIIELKKRITSWKKPLVYLEHIIEPRINWLLDLAILKVEIISNVKQYYLSEAGLNLVFIILNLYEKHLNKQLILHSFINQNYLKSFSTIFKLEKTIKEVDKHKVEKYLFEAFQVFKTSAPNRIAASQGIDYVCFKLFFEDDIILEAEDFKKYLQKENTKFSMDWFQSENDGALYLKK